MYYDLHTHCSTKYKSLFKNAVFLTLISLLKIVLREYNELIANRLLQHMYYFDKIFKIHFVFNN